MDAVERTASGICAPAAPGSKTRCSRLQAVVASRAGLRRRRRRDRGLPSVAGRGFLRCAAEQVMEVERHVIAGEDALDCGRRRLSELFRLSSSSVSRLCAPTVMSNANGMRVTGRSRVRPEPT